MPHDEQCCRHLLPTLMEHALRLAFAFIMCVLLALPGLAAPPDWTVTGRAIVIDGDTLKLDGVTVRLSGIDAPEKGQKCTSNKGQVWDCGAGSTDHLRHLIGGEAVTCHGEGTDQYRRKLAVCNTRTLDLNQAMVVHGWAVDYRQFSKGKYAAAEDEARKNKQALWSGNFMKPWDWRRSKQGM